MSSRKFKLSKYASLLFNTALLAGVFTLPAVMAQTGSREKDDLQNKMEIIKSEMEKPDSSPEWQNMYNRLIGRFSDCGPIGQFIKKIDSGDPLAPAAPSLCINGTLAVSDPDYNRVLASSGGTGIGTGAVGNCSLSGTATAANHDNYSFNLSGCAAFPTEVTATLCGPAGCQHLGNVDTMMTLYRNVPAGDPLTANGGLPAVFNPASPCTNARAAQDDLGTTAGTTNNPGGSTCNQAVGANCVAPCTSPSNAGGLSGFRRQLGNGRFTIVVAGFSNTTVGSYNLYLNAPAAGCIIALAPSAASASIGGRIRNAAGSGIRNAIITISGASLAEPRSVRSSSFGYYTFENLQAGETYTLSIGAKRFTFASSAQVVTLNDNVADADFISEQ